MFKLHALRRPRFHDHIIRDDKDHFFIEQYITLNPLLWHHDRNNPSASHISTDVLRQELRQKHRLEGYAAKYLLEPIGV